MTQHTQHVPFECMFVCTCVCACPVDTQGQNNIRLFAMPLLTAPKKMTGQKTPFPLNASSFSISLTHRRMQTSWDQRHGSLKTPAFLRRDSVQSSSYRAWKVLNKKSVCASDTSALKPQTMSVFITAQWSNNLDRKNNILIFLFLAKPSVFLFFTVTVITIPFCI